MCAYVGVRSPSTASTGDNCGAGLTVVQAFTATVCVHVAEKNGAVLVLATRRDIRDIPRHVVYSAARPHYTSVRVSDVRSDNYELLALGGGNG